MSEVGFYSYGHVGRFLREPSCGLWLQSNAFSGWPLTPPSASGLHTCVPLWSLFTRLASWTDWLSPVRNTSDPWKAITFAPPSCSLPRRCTLSLLCQLQADLATGQAWGWFVPGTRSNFLTGPFKLLSLGLTGNTLSFPIARLGVREKGRRKISQLSKPPPKKTSMNPSSVS